MIIKTNTGSAFYSLLHYIIKKEGAKILFKNKLFGHDISSLNKQFTAIALEKPNIKKPVWSSIISVAKTDNVSDELFVKIAQDYLMEAGFSEDHQYIIVRHTNTENPHIHLLASRISMSNSLKIVSDYYCKNRSAQISDKLEDKYNLTVAQKTRRKGISTNRTAKSSIKAELGMKIRSILDDSSIKTWNDFQKELQKNKISMILHSQSTGRVYGISFSMDRFSFKGSSINKDFSVSKLNNRLELENGKQLEISKKKEQSIKIPQIVENRNQETDIPRLSFEQIIKINEAYDYDRELEEIRRKQNKKRKPKRRM